MPFTLEKKVDLEGFEPSSKRGNNMLSTCLFPLWFSNLGKTGTTNQDLSLKNFIAGTRLPLTIPDLSAPPDQDASGRRLLGDVSFLHLVQE